MTTDVLIITALKLEHDAAEQALLDAGVVLEVCDRKSATPYRRGSLAVEGGTLSVALARPTRMGPTPTATLAAALSEKLRPRCLAMCGVCAGNPSDVVLGDVIVAECAYAYDEGKRTSSGFEADHRQIPLNEKWLRFAQEIQPHACSTFEPPSESEAQRWLLVQLKNDADPARSLERDRYFASGVWERKIKELEEDGLIRRSRAKFILTAKGIDFVDAYSAYDIENPRHLPFAIHVGPIASGNVVVKDGLTWDMLKALGVRTVLGLEMEAAAIAQVAQRMDIPYWLVAKGVMDYANPKKNDKIKHFAASASAEVLILLLKCMPFDPAHVDGGASQRQAGSNTIGNVSGNNISITQSIV